MCIMYGMHKGHRKAVGVTVVIYPRRGERGAVHGEDRPRQHGKELPGEIPSGRLGRGVALAWGTGV